MGVINNQIKIAGLEASTAGLMTSVSRIPVIEANLSGVMTSVSRIPVIEANLAGVMTSVSNIALDVEAMGEKTQLTIEPFSARVGAIQKVYAYIRDGVLFASFKYKQLIAATGADQIQAQLSGFDYDGASNAYIEGFDETTGSLKKYYLGAYQNKLSLRVVDTVSVDDIVNFNIIIPIS